MKRAFPNRLRLFWRRRLKPFWQNVHWPVIWFAGILAIILGYRGFDKLYAGTRSVLDNFYSALQLFVLESDSMRSPIPWELEVARLLAPLIAAYTATQALVVIFREQFRQIRLRTMRNHVVICGLGKMGSRLAKTFHDEGYRVVVIEKDAENDNVPPIIEYGVTVLFGSASSPDLLRRARVQKAKHLISVCGDDGINAEVSVHARALTRHRKDSALHCLVHIVDLDLCRLLKENEIATQHGEALRLEFFNIFESGARALLKKYPPFPKNGERRSSPHLLIVGLGRMGESLMISTARAWRDVHGANGTRLPITIIDKMAEYKYQIMRMHYPQLEKVCELRILQMDIQSPDFERAEFLGSNKHQCDVSMIYICLDDDVNGLSAALHLLHRTRQHHIPIIVRTAHDSGLATLLHAERRSSEDLHAFGLLSHICKPDLLLGGTHETLARAIHEEYVRHQKAAGQTPETNPSMVPWDELPEELKESNRRQSDHIGLKLKAIGCAIAPLTDWDAESFAFTPQEIEIMAGMEYHRWNEERRLAGWKHAAGRKNIEKKTSPHIGEWKDLSEDIKELDRNTVRGLPKFLTSAGFQIYRIKKD